MNSTRIETVVGVFDERGAAMRAVDELRRAGFTEDHIGVVARAEDTTLKSAPVDEPPRDASRWEEAAATGVAAGAGIGALWALGIVAGVLPAIGPVVAGGVLASVLASAAGAAAVGGVLGGLIGLGIPEDEARYYEQEFHIGRTIVTVRTDRANEAREILHRHGAWDMHTRRRPATAGTTPSLTPSDRTDPGGCCGGSVCAPPEPMRGATRPDTMMPAARPTEIQGPR